MEGQCGCGLNSNVFEIFQGQDKTMTLRALYQQSGLPLDLTSCTEIVVALPKNDGTTIQLKLSLTQVAIVSPPVAGQITVPITAVNSALLNVGLRQNIDVAYTIGGLVTVVRYFEALTVLQSPV